MTATRSRRAATALRERGAARAATPSSRSSPRIARDRAKKTVDLVFDIAEGPRVYIERIDITGNTRTKDKVIRREFRMAEGDAFNAAPVRQSRQRLQDLGYFNSVTVTPSPGSAPDKAILNTTGGREGDRRADPRRRLLDRFRRADQRRLARAQPGRHRHRRQHQRHAGAEAQPGRPVGHRPIFPRPQPGRPGSTSSGSATTTRTIASYSERRTGGALRLGYEFNEHLRQAWTYTLVDRNVYNVQSGASIYVIDQAGHVAAVAARHDADARLSRQPDRSARAAASSALGADYAGIGGTEHYLRSKIDGQLLHSAGAAHRGRWLRSCALGRRRLPGPAGARGEDHRPLLPRRRQFARLPVGRRRPARGRCAARWTASAAG